MLSFLSLVCLVDDASSFGYDSRELLAQKKAQHQNHLKVLSHQRKIKGLTKGEIGSSMLDPQKPLKQIRGSF
jgi:hypothetical protein